MNFEYSSHWKEQKRFRPEITDDLIELCIRNAAKTPDRYHYGAWNAIAPVPPSGRTLKVVYRESEQGKTIKIITTYWL